MIRLAAVLRSRLAQANQAESGQESIGAVWNEHLLAEVADSHHWPVPFIGVEVPLPQWPPIHLGTLAIDLSPTKHVVSLLLASTLCALVMIWTARKMHGERAHEAPSGLANMIEAFVIYLRDEVAMRGMGSGGEKYVPLVLTLFFFILFANLLGLLPFGSTATVNIAVTGALAILALVVIEGGGLLSLGPLGYMKTIFIVPPGLSRWGIIALLPILLILAVVELLAKLTRIFALAIRLFANMTAGHIIVLSLLGLVFIIGGQASGAGRVIGVGGPVAMAVAVMLLELFVAFLQAYIFALLTSVFIGLVRHPH